MSKLNYYEFIERTKNASVFTISEANNKIQIKDNMESNARAGITRNIKILYVNGKPIESIEEFDALNLSKKIKENLDRTLNQLIPIELFGKDLYKKLSHVFGSDTLKLELFFDDLNPKKLRIKYTQVIVSGCVADSEDAIHPRDQIKNFNYQTDTPLALYTSEMEIEEKEDGSVDFSKRPVETAYYTEEGFEFFDKKQELELIKKDRASKRNLAIFFGAISAFAVAGTITAAVLLATSAFVAFAPYLIAAIAVEAALFVASGGTTAKMVWDFNKLLDPQPIEPNPQDQDLNSASKKPNAPESDIDTSPKKER